MLVSLSQVCYLWAMSCCFAALSIFFQSSGCNLCLHNIQICIFFSATEFHHFSIYINWLFRPPFHKLFISFVFIFVFSLYFKIVIESSLVVPKLWPSSRLSPPGSGVFYFANSASSLWYLIHITPLLPRIIILALPFTTHPSVVFTPQLLVATAALVLEHNWVYL